MEDKISVKVNWHLLLNGSGSLTNTISTKCCDEDEDIESIDIDEIVGEERAALLEWETSICEIQLKVIPTYIIHGFALISECSKLEVCVGPQHEYMKTNWGELLDDFGGTQVYRFNVSIKHNSSQQNIRDLTLRLFPNGQQFWIYGMIVLLKECPTTSIFSPSKINLNNVDNILSGSNHKLSPNAEKCKDFLQTYMTNRNNLDTPPNLQTMMSMLNAKLSLNDKNGTEYEEGEEKKSNREMQNIVDIKEYLDFKLLEMQNTVEQKLMQLEDTIEQRLQQIEQTQNEKFDKIINLLQNKSLT